MKKISLFLILCSMFLSAKVLTEQLQFSPEAVSKSLPGDPASSAVSQIKGDKQTVSVMLPKHAAIKDLKSGDLIYLRSGVYRIKKVENNMDGSVNVDIETTNLSVAKTHREFSQNNSTTAQGIY